MRVNFNILPALLIIGLKSSLVLATDHNEPEFVSGFYKDRAGSGADIYGLFGYPDESKTYINVLYTLAPVPSTGVFDPNSVHRIYLLPGTDAEIQAGKFLTSVAPGDVVHNPIKVINSFRQNVATPLVKGASRLLTILKEGNDMPFEQNVIPEIRLRFSKSGKRGRVVFRNFLDKNGKKLADFQTDLESSLGANEQKGEMLTVVRDFHEMDLFLGGRDDPFFADIGGFFRSINHKAALKENEDFRWKADNISYLDSMDAKESNGKRKRLLDIEKSQGVYNGYDWRLGNNVNALAVRLPFYYLTHDPKERVIRTWAESYLTSAAYAKQFNGTGAAK